MLLLAVAQSHAVLLLHDGSVFDWVFRGKLLKEMRGCVICLGFWAAIGVSLLGGIRSPWQMLVVAALGHVLYQARDKYLPCDKCRVPPPVTFKFTNV
jgi:hypothetical protein